MSNIVFDESHDSAVESETVVRTIGVGDLLGIKSHQISPEVLKSFSGNSVLITGAGGTIGSALAITLAPHVSKLVLVESHEPSLARVVQEIKGVAPNIVVVPSVINLKNERNLREVLRTHIPAFVFHTAAFKHVDLAESNRVEAVFNNFVASVTLAAECANAGVKHFVFTSSDKAVYPNNILGASKRAVERYLLMTDISMNISAVRLVNVIGSSSSVAKIFEKQINAGANVTVTDPNMKRYVMSVADAVYLIVNAIQETERAEQHKQLYMLNPGDPVAIKDLAQKMVEFSGKNLKVEFSGMRPGEKIGEDLLYEYETFEVTDTQDVMRISFPKERVSGVSIEDAERVKQLIKNPEGASDEPLEAFLKLVPEYTK